MFVSQVVPQNIKAGLSFQVQQAWKNTGLITWDSTFLMGYSPNAFDFTAQSNTFTTSVASNATATTELSFLAPNSPGIYDFSRQLTRGSKQYGDRSPVVSIRVWGDPICTNISVNKPYTYDLGDILSVKFDVNEEVTSLLTRVWNESSGVGAAKTYTPIKNGLRYDFSIPLKDHSSAFGTYRIKVDVNNVMATGSCEASFELRPLDVPVATLQALIGTGSTPNSFAVGQTAAQDILQASITRTDNQALVLDLVGSGGATAATANLAAGAGTINLGGARWIGDAWSMQPYTLRVRYADPGAASQGKNLEIPVTLILTPNGNTLQLGIAPGHPLVATSAVARGAQAYDGQAQGAWESKVGVQGGADLDSLQAMDGNGQRQHALDYNTLYGKSLVSTARAVPPAGITLLSPLEITSVAKIPTLPVKNLQATDGTLEDVVRVSWDAPAEGASGFTYDVWRDGEQIQANKTGRALDDVPPVRGQEYSYRVVATLNVDKSAEAQDPGHVPACRAARLVGATLNADMSAINGLIEQWPCLAGVAGTSAIDAGQGQELGLQGAKTYKAFSVAVPLQLKDGAHVLHLGLDSAGVVLNASRSYEVPFNLNRAAIAVKDLTITYDGAPAKPGQEASSIGRFGIRMDGGAGIGFAEEVR